MTAGRGLRCACGVKEVMGNRDLWRALLAEFVGVFFLVLVGCGSGVAWPEDRAPLPRLHGALAAGLAVAVLVHGTCHVSGGHLNPAVTLALLSVGHVSVLRAAFYVLTQCVGAMVGAAVLRSLTPDALQQGLGVTRLHELVGPAEGFGIELLITFVFMFTILAAFDEKRRELQGVAAVVVGLVVAVCHLYAIPSTGCSLNPARSFGPALMNNFWEDHWVYWLGPCVGSVAAALFYEYTFRTRPEKGPKDDPLINSDASDENGSRKRRTTEI